MTEPPLNEAERCLLVIMGKLKCEEMAEFLTQAGGIAFRGALPLNTQRVGRVFY